MASGARADGTGTATVSEAKVLVSLEAKSVVYDSILESGACSAVAMFNVPSAKHSSENSAWQITDAATAEMDPEGAGTFSEDADAGGVFRIEIAGIPRPHLACQCCAAAWS